MNIVITTFHIVTALDCYLVCFSSSTLPPWVTLMDITKIEVITVLWPEAYFQSKLMEDQALPDLMLQLLLPTLFLIIGMETNKTR